MTFRVQPDALRTYAARLAEAKQYAQTARSYVGANGNFSAQQSGLIGYLVPHHATYVDALIGMLDHISAIADESEASMKSIASTYEHTDQGAAQKLDASYPEVARPSGTHEPFEPSYRPPTSW